MFHLVNPGVSGTAENILHGPLLHLVETAAHDDGHPDAGHQEDHHPVEDGQGGDDGHRHEPEPEKDVNLLIDDVYGKYALDIVPGRRRRFTGQLNKYQMMNILNG